MATPTPDHRRLFSGDPAGYERARPAYPSRVYEILTERCGLRPGAATLEIGPGSGLATRRLPFPLDADARLADLRAAGVFDEIDHEIMPWPARFTPSQVRALASTFPNISGLPEPRRPAALDALAAIAEQESGGLVERTFYTSIYIARRA